MPKYLAIAVLLFIASPQLNKEELVHTPPQTVHQSVQLVEEIPEPVMVQQEALAPVPTPTQNTPKQMGCEAYRSEVAKYSDWDVNIMLAIAKGESNCRSEAKGDNHLTYTQNGRTYGYSLGIFQVRILPGRERCDTYDVQVNVRCAHDIYKSQGYKAWTVFTKGIYKKHL